MKIVPLVRAEFARLTSSRLGKASLAAIMIVPIVYGGLYLWGNQDPYKKLDAIPAALVVSDTGATVDKKTVNYGADAATSLIDDGTFGWKEVSASAAAAGVKNGTYDFSITFPASFSSDLASAADDDPTRARLVLTTNDTNSYLSTTLAKQAAATVRTTIATEVGKTATATLLSSIADIRDGFVDASSGASTLSDGAADAASGASSLATGAASLSSGASTLADGSATLSSGASALATGTKKVATGASTLSSGLKKLDAGTKTLPTSAKKLSDGATSVSTGASSAATGAKSLESGTAQLAALAPTVQSQVAAVLAVSPVSAATKAGILAELQGLTTGTASASAGASSLSSGLDTLSSGASQVAAGAKTLSASAPTLANGVHAASTGAQTLARGAKSASSGAAKLSSGAADAASGASKVASGAASLSSGADSLSSGTTKLATGATKLSDSLATGLDKIPATTKSSRSDTAAAVADPVAVTQHAITEAANYGAGLAPFFISLSSWIGIYALFLLVRPLSRRALTAVRRPVRTMLAGWATPALLGAVQMVGLFAVVTLALHLAVANGLGLVLFMMFVAITFAAIVLALNVLFGSVGQFLGLILMIVQLVTAGGTFPWQTLPGPLAALHYALPMGHAVDGVRQLMYGGSGTAVWAAFWPLLIWLVAALAISTYGAARQGRFRSLRELRPSAIGG
ncbi:YhgE/Pip domain-containing protein [soil metagenome]